MGSEAEAAADTGANDVQIALSSNRSSVSPSVSKKTLATWKKQLKNLKTKDAGKKADGLRYCVRDDRFFREQAEVLPLLIGFLSRVKMPEVIVETLRTFKTLFSPADVNASDDNRPVSASEGEPPPRIDPDANIQFVVESSCTKEGRAWNAGEPFIQLITASVSPEIKVQAIQVFGVLVGHCIRTANAHDALQLYQSAGSPSTALLGCLAVDHGDLELATLECLSLLFETPPSDEYLTSFQSTNELEKLLPFTQRPERRYHRPVLRLLETFSHSATGREYLRGAGAPAAIKAMLESALETTNSTFACATTTPATPVTLAQEDAVILHWSIATCSRVFSRMLFAKEHSPYTGDLASDDMYSTALGVIDVLIASLQREINTIVAPPPPPAAPTGNNAAAQAAAAAALATFSTLAQLFPFSSGKCVDIVTSLGRMIESSDACAQYGKDRGLLAVAIQAYRIPSEQALHQSVDKLLHLCSITKSPPNEMGVVETVVDPQLLSSKAMANADGETTESPALLAVDTINSILDLNVVITINAVDEPAKATSAMTVLFRLVRWLAFVVDAPANAAAMKALMMGTLVRILLETPPSNSILCGFLSKCIQAIATQSGDACELCSTDGRNPIPSLLAFLHSAYPPVDPMPLHKAVSVASEIESALTVEQSRAGEMVEAEELAATTYPLEFINENGEPSTFAARPLTAERHAIDAMHHAAMVIETFASAFARSTKATPRESGGPDFAELLASRLATTAAGSTTATPSATKKKPADAVPAKSLNGEAIVLCVLEKAPEIFKLLYAFCSKSAEVSVSLITTIRTLVELPNGVAALLMLAMSAMLSAPESMGETSEPASVPSTPALPSAFPWSLVEAQHSEFGWLLSPIVQVFETPVTCFFQMEAAVELLNSLMTQKDSEATNPVAVTNTAVVPSIEITVNNADRFANVAVAQGLLVYLIAVLDNARVPKFPNDLKRRQRFASSVTSLVEKLIILGDVKQRQALARKQELLELHELALAANAAAPATTGGKPAKGSEVPTSTIDIASLNEQRIEYKQRWAAELLDATFDVPRFGYRRIPALLLTTQISHDAIARALLEAGVAPDATSTLDATTPLMLALLMRNHTLVQAMLQAGASVDAITQDGCDLTVWCCALTSPIREDVSSLLSRTHASITLGERSPLEALVTLDAVGGTPDVVIFEKLLELGLDVNVSNVDGDFLLHAVLSKCIVRKNIRGLDLCYRYDSTQSLSEDTLRYLVGMVVERFHGDLDACNRMGHTPLHVALLNGHGEIALYLLEKGANPNVRDGFGFLPIHYACLGLCRSEERAIQVIDTVLEKAARFEAKEGVHCDRRKYKTGPEKVLGDVEKLLDDGLMAATAPTSITKTMANPKEILATTSAMPDGFLPWHLACGACSHLNGSSVCLSDEMYKRFLTNGSIRATIIQHLAKHHIVSLESRTGKQLTALHLAIKTDVDGSNSAVVDLLLSASPSLLNAVHEPTMVDSQQPLEEGSVVEVTTEGLLYVPQAHVSTRSLQHKYHVILPNGIHLDDLSRDQLKVSAGVSHHAGCSRYTLHMESAFSALHYALQTSDEISRKLLAIDGVSLQLEGCDLPLLALACAARRAPDIVRRLVSPQVNVRVHLPLHDGTSREKTMAVKAPTGSGSTGGGGGGGGRAASRKQAVPLHYAVIYEDAEMVRALVEHKEHTNVNVRRSGDGFTPLHLACEMGNMEIIMLLLDHGANFIQMSTVSSSSSGVTPLHLLIKSDGVENDKLKALIERGYVKREMLLEGIGAPVMAGANKKESEARGATGSSQDPTSAQVDDAEVEISCVLLDEEEHNLSLFNHVEQRLTSNRGGAGYRLRLQTELAKSDEVLTLCFDLINGNSFKSTPRNRTDCLTQVTEEDVAATDTLHGAPHAQDDSAEAESVVAARHHFAQLKHWHDCYAQQKVRSKWAVDASSPVKMLRRSSFDRRSTSKLLQVAASDADTSELESVPM